MGEFYALLNGESLKNHSTTGTPLDLNNAKYPGGYYISGSVYTNAPTNAPGYLLVFGQSVDRLAQLYLANDGAGVYYRNYRGAELGYSSWARST